MRDILRDFAFELRMLFKRPGFSAVVLLTLALGIGANTTIFSVVNAVLIRPLSYADPDRLTFLSETSDTIKRKAFSLPNFNDYQSLNHTFERISAFRIDNFNLIWQSQPERLPGAIVSSDTFQMLGVNPALGRTLLPDDDRPDADPVLVLSYELWQRRFGGDPNIVTQTLTIDGKIFTVVGIMPAQFRFPPFFQRPELWMPLGLYAQRWLRSREERPGIYAIGRLSKGVTIEQARTEMDAIASQLESQYPSANSGSRISVLPLRDQVIGSAKPALLIPLAAVGVVLLIACANVANLLLARGIGRRKEISIRLALGASRTRVIRQLLAESLLLSLLGAALGLALSMPALKLLTTLSPGNIPRVSEVNIDGSVLVFTLALSVLTGIVFGLVPALHSSKADLTVVLNESGRGIAGSFWQKQIRGILVIFEVALMLVLLVISGGMLRSFVQLVQTSPGFSSSGVLTMQISLPAYKYSDDGQRRLFFENLVRQVTTLPGVESAAVVAPLPVSGIGLLDRIVVEGQPVPPPSEIPWVDVAILSPDYFRVMDVPLMQGRYFTDRDSATSVPVAIIDDEMAGHYWPNEIPLGKRIRLGPPGSAFPWLQVIGVVGHIKNYGVAGESRMQVFRPVAQQPFPAMALVTRSKVDPGSLSAAIQQQVSSIDKDQPVFAISTMDRVVAASVASRRLSVVLLGMFSALALTLSSVGVYALMANSVREQMREISIKMALGADYRNMMKALLGQGAKLVVIGAVIGVVASLAFGRVLGSLLFEMPSADGSIYLSAVVILFVTGLASCYLAARRIKAISPMTALRQE